MKSRYCYSPMAGKKIGRRVTMMDRFRRWKNERENRKDESDVYRVTGFFQPIYPGK